MAPTTGASNLSRLGIVLIALTGIVHLIEAPEYFEEERYVGILFVAAAIGAAIAMYGIVRDHLWGWLLGFAVAGGSIVAYLASRTIGLPGFRENSWAEFMEPSGVFSLFVEVLFCLVAIRAFTQQPDDLSPEKSSPR
jgi:hypothetical protein